MNARTTYIDTKTIALDRFVKSSKNDVEKVKSFFSVDKSGKITVRLAGNS